MILACNTQLLPNLHCTVLPYRHVDQHVQANAEMDADGYHSIDEPATPVQPTHATAGDDGAYELVRSAYAAAGAQEANQQSSSATNIGYGMGNPEP